MKSGTFGETFAGLFSRLFPKEANIELKIDASPDAGQLYFEPQIKHQGYVHVFADLGKVPAKIKVGSSYVKVSKKNRQTLQKLAEFDPTFEPRKGFVFHEKDVPEVLDYLKSKGSAEFSDRARKIVVDGRPLEYAHAVGDLGDEIGLQTALTDADGRVKVETQDQFRSIPDSHFVGTSEGYFRKPRDPEFRAAPSGVGYHKLAGEQVPLFLLYDLKKIQRHQNSRVDASIADKHVSTSKFEPNVSVDVEGSWIWLDVSYQAERFRVPFNDVESQPKTQQFLRREKDAWVQIDRPTHNTFKRRIENIPEVERQGTGFRAPTRSFQEVQALLNATSSVDASEAFKAFIESLENFSSIEDCSLPKGLRVPLRDYQKHGYNWMCFLRKYGLNGILADEMGLGKTAQTITTLLDTHSRSDGPPSLIVCPPTVLSAWEDDSKKFVSPVDLRIGRFVGANRKSILKNLGQYDAVLTTYTTVTKDIESLSKFVWNYVVLDEAQKVKNPSTATAKACKQLVAHHKLALTGTPVENRLSELWSIFDFLMPSYLGTHGSFKTDFEIPIMKSSDKASAEKLKKRINPFKLRRLKTQVLKDLPEKIPMDRYCELTPEQVVLYKEFAEIESARIRSLPGQNVRVDTSVLTAILRLKQICCHPALVRHDIDQIYGRSGKMEAFMEIVDELVEQAEKALVFSQFTGMLEILKRVLEEKGIVFFYLDGQTPINERARLKEDFQNGKAPFFLISLKAGGVGITLTEANCVIHYDRWWNPAVEDQATDRAHRIGQTKPVKVFRIHTKGTIEERIGKLLIRKKDLFDSVIEADDLKKEISKEELLALFAPPHVSH
jgi:superfamily II DNA or RNA helicase